MSVRQRHAVFSLLAVSAALAVVGCGSGPDDAPSSSASTTSPSVQTTTPTATPTPTDEQSPTPTQTDELSPDASPTGTTPQPTGAPTPTAGATDDTTQGPGSDAPQDSDSGAANAAPRPTTTAPPGNIPGGAAGSVENCRAQDLTGDVRTEQGTAGSVILSLTLTNNGGNACQLSGYPGVSFADASGEMIGVPAERVGSGGSEVTMLPDESASVEVKQSNAANHGQVCNPHTTASLVVYPPESYDSISVPYETQACGNPKISQLEIKGFGG